MKWGILFLLFTTASSTLHAEEVPAWTFFETAGSRAGIGFNRETRLESFEFFATSPAIKEWAFSPSVTASLHVEGAMGFLTSGDDTAFTGRLGSLLEVSFNDSPIHLVFSTGLAHLSEERSGNLDLGSKLQFISGVGLDWELSPDWVLGYRWLHISNAGINRRNPGLNLNTVSLGFRF